MPMTMSANRSAVITSTHTSTPTSDQHDHGTDDVHHAAVRRQRVGDVVGLLREVLAGEGVLRQADRHAECRGGEAPVEAGLLLQQPGQQRAEQGADVDAHVEQREARIAARVVLVVERADQRRGVGLDTPGAEGDQHQAEPDAGEVGHDREGDVARHHADRGVEEGALGTDQPVGEPGTEDGGEVDRTAVGPDDAGRDGLVDAEAALGGGVVEVDEQDALHAVEAEPLPQLHPEQVRQHTGLAEEAGVGPALRAAPVRVLL